MKYFVKEGVSLSDIDRNLLMGIGALQYYLWDKFGYKLTITSGRDGKHKDLSLHYIGKAVDIRTHDWPFQVTALYSICVDILSQLDYKFDVVLEKTHIHIEYDYKKGS